MKDLEFERIGHNLERTEVPEGWLIRDYRMTDKLNNSGCAVNTQIIDNKTLTFIPDPEHLWLKE